MVEDSAKKNRADSKKGIPNGNINRGIVTSPYTLIGVSKPPASTILSSTARAF
jgi:hypothetical protein